jgi:tetratricopeptide (TPR) repeat protein
MRQGPRLPLPSRPEPTPKVDFPARRTHAMVLTWRAGILFAKALGTIGRWLFVDFRAVLLTGALAPALIYAIRGEWQTTTIAASAWFLAVLFITALNTRGRLIIGEFTSAIPTDGADSQGGPEVNVANLLLVEISRLADLFRVVGDQRAVSSGFAQESSGFAHERSLDTTLTVDDLVQNLQGAVSADAKASIGPLTLPLAPFVAIIGALLQSPKLTGHLHRDGGQLILTAQTNRRRSLSWRVGAEASPGQSGKSPTAVTVSGMVEELALRIYTDLVLGRAVRWEATRSFVEGLRSFRACLRTPKDRKVNLQRAEGSFLTTLSEDEDFPLLYYNLGVVYTELHGLAIVAGRDAEARARLSAAETSFGRAIEKDPDRWEAYFGFAQTQYRYARYDSVVELCRHIIGDLRPRRGGKAKAHELCARALVVLNPSDHRLAMKHARTAGHLALRSYAYTLLLRRSARNADEDAVSRCADLAAGCVLTFSDIYSRQMPPVDQIAVGRLRHWRQRRVQRRVRSVAGLAPIRRGKAELRYDFGRRLNKSGHHALAVRELASAVQSDPTRPAYAAELAFARVNDLLRTKGTIDPTEREQIVALCYRAVQAMAAAFFPSRDKHVCETVARVYRGVGSKFAEDLATAEQLEAVADDLASRLEQFSGETSVSGIFLDSLQAAGLSLSSRVGEYAEAAHSARKGLAEGQALSKGKDKSEALAAFRGALDCAERATALNPLSTLAWETLGDIHRELSDFQNAERAWSQALATDPDNPHLYDRIGSSYWHIAFQGRAGPSADDLKKAARQFDAALSLYESGHFEERLLTHYRLGKLNAALRDFDEARRHLDIVAAVQARPPILGWEQLGFAYLEKRNFPECEYYFGRVVREGKRLAEDEHLPPDEIVGDRLDEEEWPLALIRAWGHLGLAITYAERDGNLDKAEEQVDAAAEALEGLALDPNDPANDERFPTRSAAAVIECRGLIALRRGAINQAVDLLERAVSEYPHSRAYYELALALEQQAGAQLEARQRIVPRAQRLLTHASKLGPGQPTFEVDELAARLDRLLGSGSVDGPQALALS